MSDKTYVKHIKTGEVFEVAESYGTQNSAVYDDRGEGRLFKREVLVPYDEPEVAWEDVPGPAVSHYDGYLAVWYRRNWQPVPSDYTRTIIRDGKLVVQRRKG